jgi:hypothetical protein
MATEMASGEPAIEIIAAAGSIPDVEADGLAGIEFGGGGRCCESDRSQQHGRRFESRQPSQLS